MKLSTTQNASFNLSGEMNLKTLSADTVSPATGRPSRAPAMPFANPRDFGANKFVYTVISPRARGLSIGVNMNPDKKCNFDCVYCEVDRSLPSSESQLSVPVMIAELNDALSLASGPQLAETPRYRSVPSALLKLQHVALSGDGEPTLAPNFQEAVEAVLHLRAKRQRQFFKLVLITNASGLDRPDVLSCIQLFTSADEVWAKLDAGSQSYFKSVNRSDASLDQITANILNLARRREVTLQSLFPSINGAGIPMDEIEAFANRVRDLKEKGARIKQVQIYSADRPTGRVGCAHLPLRTLSEIAAITRRIADVPTEVF